MLYLTYWTGIDVAAPRNRTEKDIVFKYSSSAEQYNPSEGRRPQIALSNDETDSDGE